MGSGSKENLEHYGLNNESVGQAAGSKPSRKRKGPSVFHMMQHGVAPPAQPPPPPDLTDAIIREAQRAEMARQGVGRTRQSTFLAGGAGKTLLGG